MKHIIILLSLSFTTFLCAQTKLINHKSHSGTNSTFKPNELYGNFGLDPKYEDLLKGEIDKDISSKYKFFYDSKITNINNNITSDKILMLVETDDKKATMLTLNSRIIEEITVASDSEFLDDIEIMLLEKLKTLRKDEKK